MRIFLIIFHLRITIRSTWGKSFARNTRERSFSFVYNYFLTSSHGAPINSISPKTFPPFHGNLLSAEITKLLSRRFFSPCFERTQQCYGITNDIFLFPFSFFFSILFPRISLTFLTKTALSPDTPKRILCLRQQRSTRSACQIGKQWEALVRFMARHRAMIIP